MRGSHFLLLLEIFQSFEFFSLYWKLYFQQHTKTWFEQAAVKNTTPLHPPPHSPFCTYTHTHTYVVWGTNSLLTASSLLSPHSLAFISPLCTSMFFQTISPDLLSLLTSQQMGNEQKKLCKN